MGEDGTTIGKQKLQALRDNSNYFRMRLQEMGLNVLGRFDSPIMPVMLYNPTKIAAFSHECLKRGLAVVGRWIPSRSYTNVSRSLLHICWSLKRGSRQCVEAY